jgi:hypothetical protein
MVETDIETLYEKEIKPLTPEDRETLTELIQQGLE